MKLEQLQELLETPEVKEALELELKEAVSTKQAALDAKMEELVEEKKKIKKQLFLVKKTLTAKSNLYENKLKQYYEAKFDAATKKVADSVYDFINESVASLVKNIQEDVSAGSKTKKLEESVSQALRALIPHANMSELVVVSEPSDALKNQLNNVIKENKLLKARCLSEELDALVISECAGYPITQLTLVRETLKKVDPQPVTLVEAKESIKEIKEVIRRNATAAPAPISIPRPIAEAKEALKADNARVTLRKVVEENKVVVSKAAISKQEPVSALAYDIADV